MAAARDEHGNFIYPTSDILAKTGIGSEASLSVTLAKARAAGISIPSRRAHGGLGATAAPGGQQLPRLIAAMERDQRNGAYRSVSEIAESLGMSQNAAHAVLTQARHPEIVTSRAPFPQALLDRLHAVEAARTEQRTASGISIGGRRKGQAGAILAPLAITAGGAAALSSPDEAQGYTPPPQGAESIRAGLYVIPDNGQAPSLDGAQIHALGPERRDLALAILPDGNRVILRRDGNSWVYYGRAWSPPSALHDLEAHDHPPGSMWPLIAAAAGGLIGGRFGRARGALRANPQPILGRIVGAAGGGALGGGAASLLTGQDLVQGTGLGAGIGIAATGLDAGAASLYRAARGADEVEAGAIRPRPSRARDYEHLGALDQGTLNTQIERDNHPGRPESLTAARQRQRGSQFTFEQRAALRPQQRGYISRYLGGQRLVNLQRMARASNLSDTGTREELANRLAQAARRDNGLYARWHHLYPWMGAALLATSRDSDVSPTRPAPREAHTAPASGM